MEGPATTIWPNSPSTQRGRGYAHSRPAQQRPMAGAPCAFCKVAPTLSRYYAAPRLTIAQETRYAPSTQD